MKRPSVDAWAIELCEVVAKRSHDPSTKVGAVILRPDNTVASMGYNGFPRGVEDDPERYADRKTKYAFVCHAEANAIVTAHEPLHGYAVYTWPFPPCNDCAKLIIQAGIDKVVAPRPTAELAERWKESLGAAETMFEEAGVDVVFV